MADVELPVIEEKAEEKKVEDLKFPALGNGPAVFYETERHELWMGIPFDKVNDPNMVTACLDRAKYESLIYLSNYHQTLMRKKQLEISPLGGKIKKTMNDLFQKGKSLITH